MNSPVIPRYVTDELCKARHSAVDIKTKSHDDIFIEMKASLDRIYGRLNWFYILTILTLGGVIVNIALKTVR